MTKATLVLILLCLSCACAAVAAASEPSEYVGYVSRELNVYTAADDNSRVLGRLPADVDIDVYEKKRVYTLIGYNGVKGYVLTKHVERVQRRDPFGGLMPGVNAQVALARLSRDVQFKPEEYNYPIQLYQDTLLAVQKIDESRIYFPYMRLEDLMSVPLSSVLELIEIKPWDEAEPGDLIGAFSTFYSTSTKRSLNVGRMYNIELSIWRLNGVVVQAGESFSFNAICAPYTEANGYRKAPILSSDDNSVGFGGGVCQVCTTLYNVVLRIPAWIEDMHWHGQGGVKYIHSGFDATVGSKWDMCFKNVLPYAIQIRYDAYDGVMTARIHRAPE